MAGRFVIPVVFGHDFLGAFVPTIVLIPGIVFMSMTSVLNNFVAGKGYPWVMFTANLAALVVNVALNSALIAKLGIIGAAISSSLSYLCWFVALRVVYLRYLRNDRTDPARL